ncbi:hypothetical protein [Paraburkholderia phenazinium]|jgi:hypothetical protein|uniref:Uncharacterized protein n=1 Tax=Paraburkholderia phenazinium TaxID=60549 RepID=A0A1G8N5T9_9BURK|nr:hypothetical protein [Paraburkholderia phenazinium]SDI75485.1 hypothetical protein SAMN05216466_13325 [Paraburkholderia phenazinium]
MNTISSAYLNSTPQSTPSTSTQGSADQAVEQLLQDIENLLEDASGNGSGSGSGSGSDSGGGMNLGGGSGGLPQGNGGLPSTGGLPGGSGTTGAQGGAGAGATGQDLRDVKINSTAGGEALHLQEDSQGNLYNGSGNSVGHVNSDGSVSLNSGATKEIQRLETGGNPLSMLNGSAAKPEKGDGGDAVFSSSEVTVEAGDLNQANDF